MDYSWFAAYPAYSSVLVCQLNNMQATIPVPSFRNGPYPQTLLTERSTLSLHYPSLVRLHVLYLPFRVNGTADPPVLRSASTGACRWQSENQSEKKVSESLAGNIDNSERIVIVRFPLVNVPLIARLAGNLRKDFQTAVHCSRRNWWQSKFKDLHFRLQNRTRVTRNTVQCHWHS